MNNIDIIEKLKALAPLGIWAGHAGNHPKYPPGTPIFQVYPLNGDGTAMEETESEMEEFDCLVTAISCAEWKGGGDEHC
jgi:hypothetical protein